MLRLVNLTLRRKLAEMEKRAEMEKVCKELVRLHGIHGIKVWISTKSEHPVPHVHAARGLGRGFNESLIAIDPSMQSKLPKPLLSKDDVRDVQEWVSQNTGLVKGLWNAYFPTFPCY